MKILSDNYPKEVNEKYNNILNEGYELVEFDKPFLLDEKHGGIQEDGSYNIDDCIKNYFVYTFKKNEDIRYIIVKKENDGSFTLEKDSLSKVKYKLEGKNSHVRNAVLEAQLFNSLNNEVYPVGSLYNIAMHLDTATSLEEFVNNIKSSVKLNKSSNVLRADAIIRKTAKNAIGSKINTTGLVEELSAGPFRCNAAVEALGIDTSNFKNKNSKFQCAKSIADIIFIELGYNLADRLQKENFPISFNIMQSDMIENYTAKIMELPENKAKKALQRCFANSILNDNNTISENRIPNSVSDEIYEILKETKFSEINFANFNYRIIKPHSVIDHAPISDEEKAELEKSYIRKALTSKEFLNYCEQAYLINNLENVKDIIKNISTDALSAKVNEKNLSKFDNEINDIIKNGKEQNLHINEIRQSALNLIREKRGITKGDQKRNRQAAGYIDAKINASFKNLSEAINYEFSHDDINLTFINKGRFSDGEIFGLNKYIDHLFYKPGKPLKNEKVSFIYSPDFAKSTKDEQRVALKVDNIVVERFDVKNIDKKLVAEINDAVSAKFKEIVDKTFVNKSEDFIKDIAYEAAILSKDDVAKEFSKSGLLSDVLSSLNLEKRDNVIDAYGLTISLQDIPIIKQISSEFSQIDTSYERLLTNSISPRTIDKFNVIDTLLAERKMTPDKACEVLNLIKPNPESDEDRNEFALKYNEILEKYDKIFSVNKKSYGIGESNKKYNTVDEIVKENKEILEKRLAEGKQEVAPVSGEEI